MRRAGLIAGALAFLFQMTVWSVYAPAMSFGQFTPICTAEGVRLVSSDQLGRADDGSLPEQTMRAAGDCPLCLLAQGLTAPPVALTAAAPTIARLHEAPRLPGGVIAAGWYLATLKARAPPVTAA
ncbi:hypothetical protein GCM10011505_30010 [Tistrella bauzanensis]|uniref:DUF2946 domain-containing protein n=1 Tax=Tistrella bauzanensis TaxID=657419 RepID=A0ABQ1IM84_9PROT|nr:hypothetical protein GCM10011505_30010 [Tistrella bauzanensis]